MLRYLKPKPGSNKALCTKNYSNDWKYTFVNDV